MNRVSLDWSKRPFKLEVNADPIHQNSITFNLSSTEREELSANLYQIVEAGELTLRHPENWTFYFKAKTGPIRSMLARPSLNEWVVTVSINAELMPIFIERLKSPELLRLSAFGTMHQLSNLDIVF